MEAFIHGEPILNYCDEGRKEKKDREHLAKIGLETVMKMIFLYDFVHGDLHPGSYSFSVLLLLAFVSLFCVDACDCLVHFVLVSFLNEFCDPMTGGMSCHLFCSAIYSSIYII